MEQGIRDIREMLAAQQANTVRTVPPPVPPPACTRTHGRRYNTRAATRAGTAQTPAGSGRHSALHPSRLGPNSVRGGGPSVAAESRPRAEREYILNEDPD